MTLQSQFVTAVFTCASSSAARILIRKHPLSPKVHGMDAVCAVLVLLDLAIFVKAYCLKLQLIHRFRLNGCQSNSGNTFHHHDRFGMFPHVKMERTIHATCGSPEVSVLIRKSYEFLLRFSRDFKSSYGKSDM